MKWRKKENQGKRRDARRGRGLGRARQGRQGSRVQQGSYRLP